MATQREINTVTAMLNVIPGTVENCHQVAIALVETNQRLSKLIHRPLRWFSTDFDRARNQVMNKCAEAIRQIQNIRRKTLSPDLIRVTAQIAEICNCCRRCRSINLKNLKAGKEFTCLAHQPAQKDMIGGFSLKPDEKGQTKEQK